MIYDLILFVKDHPKRKMLSLHIGSLDMIQRRNQNVQCDTAKTGPNLGRA